MTIPDLVLLFSSLIIVISAILIIFMYVNHTKRNELAEDIRKLFKTHNSDRAELLALNMVMSKGYGWTIALIMINDAHPHCISKPRGR